MKINEKVLNLHPYISAEWRSIASLHVKNGEKGPILVIELRSGSKVEVPHLNTLDIQEIFSFHAKSLEEIKESPFPKRGPLSFNLKLLPGFDQVASVLQHDFSQAHTPDFPEEVLEQIAQISKSFGVEELSHLPKPEPHCNCPHCQIMRSLQKTHPATSMLEKEEEISDTDLRFRTWNIKEEKKNLYLVTNPLDDQESYKVFLGDPIGCTCGYSGCEHIQAVLQS